MKFHAHEVVSLDTRFWLRVWPRGDCWEWRGPRNQADYGVFHTFARDWLMAHRYAYTLAKGAIPNSLELDHICRHKWCVKPSHLEAVTPRTNLMRADHWVRHNLQKTHCPVGHAYTEANTRVYKTSRCCRACARAVTRKYRAKKFILTGKKRP